MAGPVISARELSLVFQTADAPVYALSRVGLEVEDGDFVSFIGPSGCGKTTLLRVIAAVSYTHLTLPTTSRV